LTTHLVIPDVQAKPGNNFTFLNNIGKYIVDKKPDTIICIGDFADMPSLSSYDKGKKSFEGRRYLADIQASHEAMEALLEPLVEFNLKAKRNKEKRYYPRMVLTLGNHEHRISRATELQPELEGVLDLSHLDYEDYGWEVYPFLEVVHVDGVAYSHYFTSGVLGRPLLLLVLCSQRNIRVVSWGMCKRWIFPLITVQMGLLFWAYLPVVAMNITKII